MADLGSARPRLCSATLKDSTSYLNQLNQIYSDFAATANDPASSINSIQSVSDVSQFTQSKSIASNIGQLTSQADSRVSNDIDQVNQLLNQIATLNVSIRPPLPPA